MIWTAICTRVGWPPGGFPQWPAVLPWMRGKSRCKEVWPQAAAQEIDFGLNEDLFQIRVFRENRNTMGSMTFYRHGSHGKLKEDQKVICLFALVIVISGVVRNSRANSTKQSRTWAIASLPSSKWSNTEWTTCHCSHTTIEHFAGNRIH